VVVVWWIGLIVEPTGAPAGQAGGGGEVLEAKSSDLPGDAVSENGIIRSVKLKEGQEVKG
jgi:hypothetical protein